MTKNWSLKCKIEPKSAPDLWSLGPDFGCLLKAFGSWKIGARMKEFGARFRVTVFPENVFLGQICYNFMRVTFTINIGFVTEQTLR